MEFEEKICAKQQKSTKMEKSPKRVTRQLRDRKERKLYIEDWGMGDADDEIEGQQSFDLEDKLTSARFEKSLVKEMIGTEFNLAYIQQNGFSEPLIFHKKDGLGIRIPDSTFNVGDVRTCVGSKRLLDVMDVKTQKNMELTMKQWQEYYEKANKDRLLNVISLEFSHTKLENFVEAPTVVRQLDWVDRVWPRHLKNMQTESTNVMDEMMYPKVQKYCLMSVKGCYTDFHVDFGGTSVWYHILRGAKVFWLIPPTDKNLELYQSWVLSGKQGDTFFGDNVDICSRVYLQSGDTFFIPSGWIHAVYTPKDSLVFGGNFLHSFGIEKQLKIATVEEQTKVPQKFRYPFFTEMLWYTLERYVHCLMGQSYIRIPSDDDEENEKEWKPAPCERLVPEDVALSPQELLGLKAIVLYLHHLPIQRKNVPALIYDPVALLRSIKQIVEKHRYDSPMKAVTGRPILIWPGEKAEDVGKVDYSRRSSKNQSLCNLSCSVSSPVPAVEEIFRRRVRCGICQACNIADDCNECLNCMARLNYNDPSKEPILRRRVCVMRDCLSPQLPTSANCDECGKDGWGDSPNAFQIMGKPKIGPSNLMECIMCLKIVHPLCISSEVCARSIAIVNEDLPNSWECPMCVDKSKPVRGVKRIKSYEEKRNNHHSSDNNSVSNMKTNNYLAIEASNGIMTDVKLMNNGMNGTTPHNPLPNGLPIYEAMDMKPDISDVVKQEICDAVERLQKKNSVDRALREDENLVRQKIDQVVRRKSTEDSMKAAVNKVNSGIKRTLSGSDVTVKQKHPRRMSEDILKNGDATVVEKTIVPPKINELKEHHEEMIIDSMIPIVKIKQEIVTENDSEDDKMSQSSGGEQKPRASPIKYPHRSELAQKIISGSGKNLKKPCNVVRPAPLTLPEDEAKKSTKKKGAVISPLKDPKIWLPVFKYFDIQTLNRCLCVSKDWNRIGMMSENWKVIDASQQSVTSEMLKGLVRRQPMKLVLNWAKISKVQLSWVISRLPQLKELSMQGSSWNTVCALKSAYCPALSGLDLSYVDHLLDGAVRELLAPPTDSRPGLNDSKSRLRHLTYLSLAGAHLSDVSLRYVTQNAGLIAKLDLSCCPRITDAGIAQLGAPDSLSLKNLTHLYISGCTQLTNISLDHLRRCQKLIYLDVENIEKITVDGLNKFLSQVASNEKYKREVVVKSSYPPEKIDATLHTPDVPGSGKLMMPTLTKQPPVGNSVVVSIMP